ncbi:hypothetical protein [Nocardia wallacei]|uniref:hypothetical protein n=1 Tax=Nocardia wallacei TaxID=480035 RepID=UPI002453A7E3|nr:hypothetical protein [Nocardia wallacei]
MVGSVGWSASFDTQPVRLRPCVASCWQPAVAGSSDDEVSWIPQPTLPSAVVKKYPSAWR